MNEFTFKGIVFVVKWIGDRPYYRIKSNPQFNWSDAEVDIQNSNLPGDFRRALWQATNLDEINVRLDEKEYRNRNNLV